MNITLIKNGDVGLFAGTSTISKLIIYFMKSYRKRFKIDSGVLKLLDGFIASHSATFFWENDILFLHGSVEFGYKPIIFQNNYSDADNFMVLRTQPEMTPEQQQHAFYYSSTLIEDSTTYPYWNLLLWILYVGIKWKWLLSWGGHKAEVCYKSAYEIKREIYPYIYTLNPLYVTFFDTVRETDEIIIDNRK